MRVAIRSHLTTACRREVWEQYANARSQPVTHEGLAPYLLHEQIDFMRRSGYPVSEPVPGSKEGVVCLAQSRAEEIALCYKLLRLRFPSISVSQDVFDEKDARLLRPINQGETLPCECVAVDWTRDYPPAKGGPDVFYPLFVRSGVLGLWMAIHIPDLLFKDGRYKQYVIMPEVGVVDHDRKSRGVLSLIVLADNSIVLTAMPLDYWTRSSAG